ncbi:hypothetical protein MIND_01222000 [Mycena indigotica]|uniref:Uncharacterized protein n=1 Tax=Mycena indigotica TaxID=2126181 RepID=A0A8H6S307_9AGAR|nr:uncharacterized protein MIND_01222000 [Mycena indigotica]KAF7291964.1 hypothetical protein MIND_01222000 [Mycena indigotica]
MLWPSSITPLFIWATLFPVAFVHGADDSVFAWRSIPQLTTCQPASLSWFYRGGSEDLTISITNQGVPQSPPSAPTLPHNPPPGNGPPRGGLGIFGGGGPRPQKSDGPGRDDGRPRHGHQPARRDLNQPVSGAVKASSNSFAWSSVNVAQGYYVLVANLPSSNTVKQSRPFFVANGKDTSCLVVANPPPPPSVPPSGPTSGTATTSPSSIPSKPTSEPSDSAAAASAPVATTPVRVPGGSTTLRTGSGAPPKGVSPTGPGDSFAPPLSTNMTTPVSGASHSRLNRGAIAGGVIGGLVVVAALLAFFLYRRYSKKSARAQAWAGLTSGERAFPPPAPSPGGGRHVHSESVGPILLHDSNVYMIGNLTSFAGGEKDAVADTTTSEYAFSQGKLSSPQHESPLSTNDLHPSIGAVPNDAIIPLPNPPIISQPSPRARARPLSTPAPSSPALFSLETYPASPTPLPAPPDKRRSSSRRRAIPPCYKEGGPRIQP